MVNRLKIADGINQLPQTVIETVELHFHAGVTFGESLQKLDIRKQPDAVAVSRVWFSLLFPKHIRHETQEVLRERSNAIRWWQMVAMCFVLIRSETGNASLAAQQCEGRARLERRPVDDSERRVLARSPLNTRRIEAMSIDEKLLLHLGDAGFDDREVNTLERYGICTVGQLLNLKPEQLLSIKGIGQKRFHEIRLRLAKIGFRSQKAAS